MHLFLTSELFCLIFRRRELFCLRFRQRELFCSRFRRYFDDTRAIACFLRRQFVKAFSFSHFQFFKMLLWPFPLPNLPRTIMCSTPCFQSSVETFCIQSRIPLPESCSIKLKGMFTFLNNAIFSSPNF